MSLIEDSKPPPPKKKKFEALASAKPKANHPPLKTLLIRHTLVKFIKYNYK